MRTLIAVANPDLKQLLFAGGAPDALAEISEFDWLEDVSDSYTSEGLARVIGQYDACLTSWGSPFFTGEVLAAAERLAFIGHAAGSPTAVVDEAAFARGITVVTANEVLARSTAEAAVALMLAGAWRLRGYSARLQQGVWSVNSRETVPGLAGQSIALIGLGEISRRVIGLLRGFPVTIRLVSRYCQQEEADALGVQLCSLEEALSTCSIVSLHSSLTPSSIGMIGSRELALIRDGSLLVNTARARLVDEEALVRELLSGRLHAALDVYHQEPLPPSHPLLTLDNVLCVPHIGGFAHTCKTAMAAYIVDNLRNFTAGRQPAGQVTVEQYQRMTANSLVRSDTGEMGPK